ncbi:hypothetical protein [Actinacidiphila yeochonensis]|uniref:hypothetical protein n=1 Tax=Actinacidiphila yeochonensis TaxID=89050 RepID=UPI00056AA63A|nr:hypothetical protein [Actinacidiphila yeochonensis]
MRLVWLAALAVLAVVMAVLTPYVFRHESVSQTVGWCVMLACTVIGVGLLVRVELLIRALDHRSAGEADRPGRQP